MSKKKISPKAAQKKDPNDDPAYIGLRLKGLARLVEYAANADGPGANPINGEAAFFISTELEEIAERLERR